MMENRQYWSAEHTRALLTIWAEDNVQRQFDGVCRNEDVMKYIVAELAKINIQRTTSQVREKLKKLRAQYKSVKIHNGRSGAQRKTFPWFDLMDEVLGHRPSVSGETTRNSMPSTADTTELSSQIDLFDSEVESGPSTPPLQTSTPERNEAVVEVSGIRGGSHHIPDRTRPETRKRKAAMTASREFIQSLQDMSQRQAEEERDLRLQCTNEELKMRREEMEVDAQLRREEMARRQKDSEAFALVLANLAAALLQK
ncbi:uncharacterized protein [Paramisgurnus dabryanus]|uniref:uncharacterized protein n=1 Tax=Paramisgurnus dabryanus TaxID=90735 RepID=UPI0031F43CE9